MPVTDQSVNAAAAAAADHKAAEESEKRLNEAGYTRAPGHVQWNPEGTMPPPDPVTESIRAELLQRQRVGWTKYGIGLGRDDFTMKDWLHHLYEELLDATQYTKRLLMTVDGTLPTAGRVEDIEIKQELPAQEIARLTREIGERQGRILQLVGGDPRESVHVPIKTGYMTDVMKEVSASPAAETLRESMKKD